MARDAFFYVALGTVFHSLGFCGVLREGSVSHAFFFFLSPHPSPRSLTGG